MRPSLKDKLSSLPDKPGVYIFKDERGRPIYVGKAASLRGRVRSYFQRSGQWSPKLRAMMRRVSDLDFIVTENEVEALLLECTLIKRHKPRYNIRLRDDKQYPYLKVTVGQRYPRLLFARRMEPDGARYFGPFPDSGAARRAIRAVAQIFEIATCKYDFDEKPLRRPCLYYHMGQCSAPCVRNISEADYKERVKGAILFLEGKYERLLCELKRRMEEEAERLNFERAAILRDQIRAIERIMERQRVVSTSPESKDAVAVAEFGGWACGVVLVVRGGKLLERRPFPLETAGESDKGALLSAFLRQYYGSAPEVPPKILLPFEPKEMGLLRGFLSKLRGGEVEVLVPEEGSDERGLVRLAEENAKVALSQFMPAVAQKEPEEALLQLKEALGLKRLPERIEAFDCSNIMGKQAVASMAVLEWGKPAKDEYRRFRIRAENERPSDVDFLKEALRRRLRRALEGEEGWAELPHLLLVDGGRPQLSAALEVLKELGLDKDVPVCALAKGAEALYLPGQEGPLILPRNSPALHVLQLARDEAHRFAISYHRRLREKEALESVLDRVPGIGEKRKGVLLEHFGSVEAIKGATIEEIASLPGMNRKVAQRLKEALEELGG